MKFFFSFLILCAVVIAKAAFAQSPQQTTPLETLIAAERAFAAMSIASDTRSAFLANVAENSILFAPEPTNGKQLWEKRPVGKSVLAWEPAFADISEAGDMGYTYGPWSWSVRKDTTPSAFGHFVSVWKKQPNGAWKVQSDMGIAHPAPAPKPANVLRVTRTNVLAQVADKQLAQSSLLAAEKMFSEASVKSGFEQAYRASTDKEITFFRNGKQPLHGQAAISLELFERPVPISWEALGSDVAQSGDIGYTYGSYSFIIDGKTLKSGYYKRIWKRTAQSEWKAVIDVTNPLPR